MRQLGFRTKARQPPTQTSVRFLLVGRSGCFIVQKQRFGARSGFFPCPASCPACSLGAHLMLADIRAHLWQAFGLWLSHEVANVPHWQPCPGGIAEGEGLALIFGYQHAGWGAGTPRWALWCSLGHAFCWSSFFYREYCLRVFLATFLPEDSRAIFQSAGAGVAVPISSSRLEQRREASGEGDALPRAPKVLLVRSPGWWQGGNWC